MNWMSFSWIPLFYISAAFLRGHGQYTTKPYDQTVLPKHNIRTITFADTNKSFWAENRVWRLMCLQWWGSVMMTGTKQSTFCSLDGRKTRSSSCRSRISVSTESLVFTAIRLLRLLQSFLCLTTSLIVINYFRCWAQDPMQAGIK